MLAPSETTALLQRMADGDAAAMEELVPMLYRELRGLAGQMMRTERSEHTLQATALVHEAWMRLANAPDGPRWQSRAHFIHAAARAMRRVLVDHARSKQASKRGGGNTPAVLDSVLVSFEERSLDVLTIDEVLERLRQTDAELGQLVELRFFAGLTNEETADVLGLSKPTVERRWRVARMWLRREIPPPDASA